jgi:DDE family transposase
MTTARRRTGSAIDDTVDVVHGRQQLSLFNAHYDEHCFLPIHVYDTEHSRPVAIILRPGKTPSGLEVRAHLRRLVRRIRSRDQRDLAIVNSCCRWKEGHVPRL